MLNITILNDGCSELNLSTLNEDLLGVGILNLGLGLLVESLEGFGDKEVHSHGEEHPESKDTGHLHLGEHGLVLFHGRLSLEVHQLLVAKTLLISGCLEVEASESLLLLLVLHLKVESLLLILLLELMLEELELVGELVMRLLVVVLDWHWLIGASHWDPLHMVWVFDHLSLLNLLGKVLHLLLGLLDL